MSTPILLTGGTGTLGSAVVPRLLARDCRVRVLSRKAGAGRDGVEYAVGDLVQGTGLGAAVAGVDVILHCASSTRGDAEAARNLVKAATAAGRRPHLVFISIVGVEGVRFGYFKTKLAAEKVVVQSGLPWTIQRATSFYDYILNGARSLTRFPVVPVPKDFRVQPIDVAEVADRLVDLALQPPAGRVPDLGGPEVSTWAEMTRQYLRATHRRRLVVSLPLPGTGPIRAGGLVVPEQGGGGDSTTNRLTWKEFLTEKAAR